MAMHSLVAGHDTLERVTSGLVLSAGGFNPFSGAASADHEPPPKDSISPLVLVSE